MSLPVPKLDDRNWSEIVDGAVARIPRLTGDWTDFNAHDPGITFIELFSWLAEMQRFRLDQVAVETNRRFLKLVDIEPLGVSPSQVQVHFDALPRGDYLPDSVFLSAGSAIAPAIVSSGPDAFRFQVARDTYVTSNAIRRVTTEADEVRLDHTETNSPVDDQSTRSRQKSPPAGFYAFGPSAPLGAVLEIEFERPFAAPMFEIWVEISEEGLQKPGAHAGEPPEVEASAALSWETFDGSEWTALTVVRDGTAAFRQSGAVAFQVPAPPSEGSFQVRCRVAGGRFEIAPRISYIRLHVVELEQIESEFNEELGKSSGRPDQVFQLAQDNVLPSPGEFVFRVGNVLDWPGLLQALAGPDSGADADSPRRSLPSNLEIPASEPPEQENRDALRYDLARALDAALSAPDFLGTSASSLDAAEDCEIDRRTLAQRRARNLARFVESFSELISDGGIGLEVGTRMGDGSIQWERWEKVDELCNSNHADKHFVLDASVGEVRFGNGLNGRIPAPGAVVRARYYSHTRGARGDLAPGQVWDLRVRGTRLTGRNPAAAVSGRDPEEIDEARGRAARRFHDRIRGVTGADLERLAMSTPGLRVGRAKALAIYDPLFPCISAPDSTAVVVVPFKRADDTREPIPSEGFKRTIQQHLERHRLLTTRLHVVGPEIIAFKISVRVFLAQRSSAAQVRTRLERDLSRYFDPLRGGADGKGWPFGRAIFPSELYELIDRDPGVEYAFGVRLSQLPSGRALDVDEALSLPRRGLPRFVWKSSDVETIAFGEAGSEIPTVCAEPCAEDGRP